MLAILRIWGFVLYVVVFFLTDTIFLYLQNCTYFINSCEYNSTGYNNDIKV